MKLELTVEAQDDLANAYEWYELDQPGRGERFAEDLFRCYGEIVKYPHVGEVDEHGLRVRRLGRFRDYGVIYKLAIPDVILVIAIWHGARNPNDLYARLG